MKEVFVNDLIQEFLQHVEIEMGRSINTVRNYELYLNRFYELCSEDLSHEMRPTDITTEMLRKYRLRLNRLDVDEFVERIERSKSRPLKVLTDGEHWHTVPG